MVWSEGVTMYLAIDNKPLIRQPHTIEVATYDFVQTFSADKRPMVVPGSDYATINCTWGRNSTYEDVLAEIERLRYNQGVHAITFEPQRGGKYLTINAYMGVPKYTIINKDRLGRNIISSFTIPFIQVDTVTKLYPLRFILRNILAVASPFVSRLAPAAGRILAVDGWINDLGSGAGTTKIQVSNGATNYLSTAGDFVCAPANRKLQNQVLGTVRDFDQDDSIDIDITAIPAGGLSRDAIITVWAWIYQP
jgi:hypothetical protein